MTTIASAALRLARAYCAWLETKMGTPESADTLLELNAAEAAFREAEVSGLDSGAQERAAIALAEISVAYYSDTELIPFSDLAERLSAYVATRKAPTL